MPDHLHSLAQSLRAAAEHATDQAEPTVAAWCRDQADLLDADHRANIEVGRQLHRMATSMSCDPDDAEMFTLGSLARHLANQATNHPEHLLGGRTAAVHTAAGPVYATASEHDDGMRP